MKTLCLAAAGPLLLTACVPTMELKGGAERARLVEIAERYCAAELSADPDDTAPLFIASLRTIVEERPADGAHSGLSAADAAQCVPGRSWYRGGSRTFIDVHRGSRAERLGFWRGAWPLIHDVLYPEPRRIAGRKTDSLREALILRSPSASRSAALPQPAFDPECMPEFHNFAFLATDTRIYRQGATVKIAPTIDKSPAGTEPVPVKCTSGWSVTGPATLSADRTALAIAPDAPPGAIVGVAFRHLGKTVELRFEIIARDAVVLTGRRAQRGVEGCAIPDPVGELQFSPGNLFSVTFQPFETYRDYWGSYSFDPASGRIAFTVEGGNFAPPGLDLEGEARLTADALTLSGLYFGSRDGMPRSDCTYLF